MKFVDEIPEHLLPKEEEHVTYRNVVRALKNNKCDVNSFLPTFLEPGRQKSFSFDPEDPDNYALSLFETIEQLNETVKPYARFWLNHEGYAIGSTNIEKGISTSANSSGHINYFLFDTFNNNPCSDFRNVEEII